MTPIKVKSGIVRVVGIGSGAEEQMTVEALRAIEASEHVVGYKSYLETIRSLTEGKQLHPFAMRQERVRCLKALELAADGNKVALVSSGDPGIYGMAGLVLEEHAATPDYKDKVEIEIIPGVSALNFASALLGAPIGHDFAVISLSDLLTPWSVITSRLRAVAEADLVVVLYNPASRKRTGQIARTRDIFLDSREATTPVGLVRKQDGRQLVSLTSLQDMLAEPIDMLTTVIVGSSATKVIGDRMVTPRGYREMGEGRGGDGQA